MEAIDFNTLSDNELLHIVGECDKDYFDDDSIVRHLAIQFFGGDSITQCLLVSVKLLPIVADRMRTYSPYVQY